MSNFLIIILLFLTIFCSSCSSPISNIDKKIEKVFNKGIEDGTIDLQQAVLQDKIVHFLYPLIFSLFISIILIFMGVRAVGIGVLISSLTCIMLVISLSMYLKYVAIIGIVVILVAIFFLGKTIFDKKRTEIDFVNSIHNAINYIPVGKKKDFTDGLKSIQSSPTKRTVNNIKNKDK